MNDPLSPDWNLDSYYFDLPPEQIAQHPPEQRGTSRMMVLARNSDEILHRNFQDFPHYLPPKTTLILNNTRVLPARLLGERATGGQFEALLVKEQQPGVWQALVKKARRIKPGEALAFFDKRILAKALHRLEEGSWLLAFEEGESLMERLNDFGLVPLPPYINRDKATEQINQQDRQRYQTCFSKNVGAIAAPTAGLHFTPEMLEILRQREVRVIEVTLHVGRGTFTPVVEQDIRKHPIHSEYFEITQESLALLCESLESKRTVIAVGTTVVRVLETLAQHQFRKASGWTAAYLYPPYTFQVTQGLLTNFHLPRSSLLMLVSAFYERERLLKAYHQAIENHYHFFSYGDCMLIL
ncbi:tRNA preQ1(34) S-adenosylmethionine ribosyltransferase-isomerase QueA [Deltaproteobacteria bacterium TL4]